MGFLKLIGQFVVCCCPVWVEKGGAQPRQSSPGGPEAAGVSQDNPRKPPEREEKNEFCGGDGKKRAKFGRSCGKGGPGERLCGPQPNQNLPTPHHTQTRNTHTTTPHHFFLATCMNEIRIATCSPCHKRAQGVGPSTLFPPLCSNNDWANALVAAHARIDLRLGNSANFGLCKLQKKIIRFL